MTSSTPPAEASLRLFVAIELSPEWLAELRRAQDAMKAAIEQRGGPRLRWVRPEGIHLTLKFLGQVPESRLTSVLGALDSATTPPPAFTLALAGMGSFGDRRGPRVIWAGLDGATVADRDALYKLVERIETWFAAAGFPREKRFAPHLTLGRVPETLSREERALIAQATATPAPIDGPRLTVDGVSLMRSHLGPGGARYERLASFPRSERSNT